MANKRKRRARSRRIPSGTSTTIAPPSASISIAARGDDHILSSQFMNTPRRRLVFASLCLACVLLMVGAVAWAVVREESGSTRATGGPMTDEGAPGLVARTSQSTGAVMFLDSLGGDHWNQVGIVPVDDPNASRSMAPLRCLRIHFAGDRGLCLAEDDGPAGTFTAYILDEDLRKTGDISLGGIPSRTRVSPDGRFGATTSFVTGHSYAEDGFSTETLLIDLENGEQLANLEDFPAFRDGQELNNEDFNYWGVTFLHDSSRFYATLATGGETYLVQGDIPGRRVDVLRENVECPSISPDNTRIVFKKRVGTGLQGTVWRFHVLDLKTMTETPLAETRSIDDQVMWLDNDRILYGEGSDTWIVPADGSGTPGRFLTRAISPVVIEEDPSALAQEGNGDVSSDAASGNVDVLTLPETDLGVSIESPESVLIGEDVSYSVTVSNNGPNDASWIVLDVYIPDNLTYVSATRIHPPDSPYGCANYGEEHRIRCDTTRLGAGERWTISVTASTDAIGSGALKATVVSAENDRIPENNQVTDNVTVNKRRP